MLYVEGLTFSRHVEQMFGISDENRYSLLSTQELGHGRSSDGGNRHGRHRDRCFRHRSSGGAQTQGAARAQAEGQCAGRHPGDAGQARSRPRADLAAAQGAPGHPRVGATARLPAVDARDRRSSRPDQHVERVLPAQHAAEEGLPAPGRRPPAHGRGASAGPPGGAAGTGPGNEPGGRRGQGHSGHRHPVAGGCLRSAGRADRRRRPDPGRAGDRRCVPAAQAAGWRGHAVPAQGGRRFNDQRRHRRRGLG